MMLMARLPLLKPINFNTMSTSRNVNPKSAEIETAVDVDKAQVGPRPTGQSKARHSNLDSPVGI
jgi:hypothetical protein